MAKLTFAAASACEGKDLGPDLNTGQYKHWKDVVESGKQIQSAGQQAWVMVQLNGWWQE